MCNVMTANGIRSGRRPEEPWRKLVVVKRKDGVDQGNLTIVNGTRPGRSPEEAGCGEEKG